MGFEFFCHTMVWDGMKVLQPYLCGMIWDFSGIIPRYGIFVGS